MQHCVQPNPSGYDEVRFRHGMTIFSTRDVNFCRAVSADCGCNRFKCVSSSSYGCGGNDAGEPPSCLTETTVLREPATVSFTAGPIMKEFLQATCRGGVQHSTQRLGEVVCIVACNRLHHTNDHHRENHDQSACREAVVPPRRRLPTI